MRKLLAPSVVLVLLAVSVACKSDSSSNAVATSAPAASPTTVATAVPTAATASLSELSLVYLDASKGQGSDLYTATADGSAPKKVVALANGSKVLDLRGRSAAIANQSTITFVDLTTGAQRPFTAPNFVVSGHFVNDNVFIFTTSGGCRAGSDGHSRIYKLDLPALTQSELVNAPSNNVSITALDTAAGVLATTPLGCDVGVHGIVLYNLVDGKQLQSVDAMGCGWSNVAIGLKKAFVSWRSCTQPPEHAGVDATLYDYAGASLVAHDLKAPGGGSTTRPWLLRPGQPQMALATVQTSTPGPAFSSKSTGIWLLDLNTLAFSNLTTGQGMEEWPVAWSPDGHYLLVASVQAQGVCGYGYVDATSKTRTPVAQAITFCGANGDVIGWTSLK